VSAYPPDLAGISKYMQDRAPQIGDPTLMALGELLSLVAHVYEPDTNEYADLTLAGYRVAVAWLMNQDRS
jgi:hypothetical protein